MTTEGRRLRPTTVPRERAPPVAGSGLVSRAGDCGVCKIAIKFSVKGTKADEEIEFVVEIPYAVHWILTHLSHEEWGFIHRS